MELEIKKDPFRLFFPIGLIFAITGNLAWVFSIISPENFGYPAFFHKSMMIGGFLAPFVVGFLMTAIPRFTETYNAKTKEIVFLILALFVSQVGILMQIQPLFSFGMAGLFGGLIFFGFQRFMQRKQNVPATFVFVGTGLIFFFISAFALAFPLSKSWESLFNILFFQGGIISLILGVGGRLIPGIFGWTEVVSKQREQYEKPLSFLKIVPKFIFILLFVFIISFGIEVFVNEAIGRGLRAVVITIVSFIYWRLHKLPKEHGMLTIFLWLSSWSLLLGSWIYTIFPQWSIHGLHIIFVGGFSLMTLMVASRVTLAHGGGNKKLEKSSKVILSVGILILLAAATRFFAGLSETGYLSHLGYAAGTWVLALIIWSWAFIPKVLKLQKV